MAYVQALNKIPQANFHYNSIKPLPVFGGSQGFSLALSSPNESSNEQARHSGPGRRPARYLRPGRGAQGVADNEQRVRALDDPVVADVEDILVESGSLFLSYAAPYSDAELRAALDRLDPDTLSEEGRAKYASALAALRPAPRYTSGQLGASASLKVDLDLDWRSDESLPWVLDYQERPSFLALPIEAWAGPGVYGYFEPALRRDYWSVNRPIADLTVPNISSVPIDFLGADGNFPFRSFGAVGGDFWSLRIGRDRLSLGSMAEDNLVVNSRTEWYDYGRLTLFFRDFQYSAYMVQLDPERNLYMHRADILLFDRLSLGLTEGVLVGQAPPELRFFNPLMIFHGYEAWNDETVLAGATSGGQTLTVPTSGVGSMLGVEIDYNPARYLTLVAQYQFNAGRDPIKLLLWPASTSQIPDSAAYLLGAKLSAPWRGGYLKGRLLAVYSEPFDMVLANDQISYIYSRHANSGYSSQPIQEWIGFSEGPDCILTSCTLGYETASRSMLELSASYRWKGQNGLGTFYELSAANADLRTPTGIVEGRFRIGADCSMPIGARWKASAAAYYTHYVNSYNVAGAADQSFELMAGLGFAL